MSTTDNADSRTFPRVTDSSKVKSTVVVTSGTSMEIASGLATNISGGGICFRTEDPYKLGTMLALELELPGMPVAVIALARVVWVQESPSEAEPERPWELGCEFHWVGWDSNVAQARIADYIRKKLG